MSSNTCTKQGGVEASRGKLETFVETWVLLKQGKYNECQMKDSLFHIDLTDG